MKISDEPVFILGEGSRQSSIDPDNILGSAYYVRRYHPDAYHVDTLLEAELENQEEKFRRRWNDFKAQESAIDKSETAVISTASASSLAN